MPRGATPSRRTPHHERARDRHRVAEPSTCDPTRYSLYFLLLPRTMAAGYFAALSINLSKAACGKSMRHLWLSLQR